MTEMKVSYRRAVCRPNAQAICDAVSADFPDVLAGLMHRAEGQNE